MATATFVAAGTYASAAGTSITPGLPAGIATDDVLFAILDSNDNVSVTVPTGWTKFIEFNTGTGRRLTVAWLRKTAAAPSTTFTKTGTVAFGGRILAYRGLKRTGNPYGATTTKANTTASATVSATALTPTMGRGTLLFVANLTRDIDATTNFSGWTSAKTGALTERIDNAASVGAGTAIGAADGPLKDSAATGVTTATAAASGVNGAALIELLDAAPTAPTLGTKFYLPSAGTPPRDPATYEALWDGVGTFKAPLLRTKSNTAHSWVSVGFNVTSGNPTPNDRLIGRFVSETLSVDQTIGGNWYASISGWESLAAADSALQMVVRVMSEDLTTEIGVVYPGQTAALTATDDVLGQEWPAGAAASDETRLITGVAGTPVVAPAGSRLQVELGIRTYQTAGVAYNAELDFGDNQAADYAYQAGVLGRTADSWVGTSQALSFGTPRTPIGYNALTHDSATFEGSTHDWTSDGSATLALTTEQAAEGTKSLKLTSLATTPINADLASPAWMSVNPGDSVTALLSARAATTPATVDLRIAWYNSAGTSVGTEFGTAAADTTTGWSAYSTTGVAPAGAAYAVLDLQIGNSAVGTSHYIDKASLALGTDTTWIDPSNNLPAAGLVGWHRADDIAQADGTTIPAWPDRSALNNDATAPSSIHQPTYKTGIANGHAVARFDGANSEFGSAVPAGSPRQTIISVIKPTDRAGDRTVRGAVDDGGLQLRLASGSGLPQLLSQATTDVGTGTIAVPTASFSVLVATFDAVAGTYAFRVNGQDAGSGTHAVTIIPTGSTMATNDGSGTERFLGDIAEQVTYSRVLTGPEIAAVEADLSSRYGIAPTTETHTTTGSAQVKVGTTAVGASWHTTVAAPTVKVGTTATGASEHTTLSAPTVKVGTTAVGASDHISTGSAQVKGGTTATGASEHTSTGFAQTQVGATAVETTDRISTGSAQAQVGATAVDTTDRTTTGSATVQVGTTATDTTDRTTTGSATVQVGTTATESTDRATAGSATVQVGTTATESTDRATAGSAQVLVDATAVTTTERVTDGSTQVQIDATADEETDRITEGSATVRVDTTSESLYVWDLEIHTSTGVAPVILDASHETTTERVTAGLALVRVKADHIFFAGIHAQFIGLAQLLAVSVGHATVSVTLPGTALVTPPAVGTSRLHAADEPSAQVGAQPVGQAILVPVSAASAVITNAIGG
jgi:hypothetical protein